MSPSDKIAIVGHNGWAARKILNCIAAQPFEKPLRILARPGSDTTSLPNNVEVARYSWSDESSLINALQGCDILLSFIGHEGLKEQLKLAQPLKKARVKLFAPSDLALPYTAAERENVQVPHEKEQLEKALEHNSVPFVTIVIGNLTSFALDSPYMGVDLANNRILHTGNSKENPVWLCFLEYVAAAYARIFYETSTASLAGRLVGLNELRPTTGDIEKVMAKRATKPPAVAYESQEKATALAQNNHLDALVRKKMGEGTHNVGKDIYEVKDYTKKTLEDFVLGEALENPRYIEPSESTLHFLDHYFQ